MNDKPRLTDPEIESTTNLGSSLFSLGDFIDLSAFVAKLRTHQDPISGYLWNQFSASTREVLTSGTSTPEQQKSALVQALNNILKGVLIYETARFDGVTLSPETQALKSQDPHGTDLIRLNRLLLEDAYPLEIAKSPNLHVDPFQLAQMVALLNKKARFDEDLVIGSDVSDPRSKWEIPFVRATALLVRAQIYAEKFNSLPITDQHSELVRDAAFATLVLARPEPKLVLLPYPKDKTSELVSYLASALSGYGCDWKTERGILENLRRWFVDRANTHNERFAESIAELEDRNTNLWPKNETQLLPNCVMEWEFLMLRNGRTLWRGMKILSGVARCESQLQLRQEMKIRPSDRQSCFAMSFPRVG